MLPTTAVRKKLKSPGQDAIPNPKTSITCSNVPEDLFEPNTAKKHFNKFGRVQRIRLFPKKLACIVEYDLPSSAERAVLNAGAFDGFMFDVTRYKPRVRKRSKKEDDPDWVPDSDVEEELSAMSGAPTYRISRQKPMDIEPEASKLKQVTRVIKQSPIKKKFAVSKKPISTPSTISGIESPLVVATTQTTMSTFEAAAELHQLRSKVALTPDEQWRILDARDRVLRAWGGAGARVKVGGATLGTCQDMCPEKELLHRQAEHQVMTLETLLDSDGQLDSRRAVKQYSRSSADQEIPMCYELRPAPVLMRTCSYLLHEIADTRRSVSLADWFHFMWDRLRGIRKDITQQAMCCAESIRLVEMCARFHAHCAARLADLEHTQFDQKLNTDNITKCLQTLKHMYTDVTADQKPREAEFRGYIALLNLGDANFWWEIKQLPENIQKSEPIIFAIQVFNALDNNNYVRFFRLVKEKATYLQACILLRYFNDVRARALARIVKAYAPRGGSRFPAMELMSALAFDSVENMKSFISHYGLRFAKSDDYELAVILDRNQFIEDSDPFPIARAIQLIETKRQTSVGQVIAGGPIPHSDYRSHSLHTSFTKDGRLTEQALVAEDQGFNTTNDSNKDVKALKAEIQRLAQGGSVYSSSHKEVEPKAPVFVKPDIRSFSPKPKTSLTAEAVQPSETKVFSFKPAITVAPTEIIENSPEKVFAEKNVFSFSKPHETDSMNVFNNIKDSSAGQTRNIFDNKVVVQDGKNMFVKKPEETKDPFKKSQNYFNSTERKETFVNKSNAPQSVFGQIDVKQNDLRSRLFGQTGVMQREPRSLFGQTEVKQDDSKSVFGQTDAKHGDSKSLFGQTEAKHGDSKSLFGQTEVKHGDAKSLFGQTGAMQSEPKSLFGPKEIKHGDSKSLFGQTEAKQSDAKSVFGKPESKQSDPRSLFAPKVSKQSDPKSLFGQTDAKQSDPKSLFGKTDQQSGPKSLFAPTESKQANPKSLFGQIDVKQSEPRSLFGTTESKQSDPKSIFGQTDSKQSGPKNLFAQTDSMPSDSKSLFGTQNSNQNLFSANKENSLFTKPEISKLDKGSNIFAKQTAQETKPSSNIFGTFNNTTEPKSLFAPPENDLQKKTPSIFNANGDIAGSNLSPGSLFKSAVNPPNGSDSKGYLIFQSKNKAQTVADNILNSVNAASQNNVYEFDKKEDDEAQRQMEEKIKEERRLLQEQIRKEEEMRRQEQIRLQEEKRKEEARRKQEELRLQEEKRKKEEARKLEELRKQEELRKRLEEEKKAELKRKAEEERKFKEAVDKESTQLVDDLVADIVNETSKELLKCEHEDFMKVVALATNITEEITYEMCNEICHSEMKAELYLTKKIMKKWFYIWRNNFFRNLKRRKMLDDTPVWLTERTPTEEALYLRRRVEDATIKNMQAIHRGYKFSGELKLLPAPEPYNIMDIIRSPLLKRMKQICYPYDKCFFWKVSMISPGEDKWLYKKINVHKWLLDAFSDNKTHDESKTLIHVSKQSWNNLMDFAISVSLLNKDKLMNECSEAIEGTNAMLFISTENDPNLIDTIEQTLKHKYSYQRVPVAVIIPKIEQSSQIKLQEILNQHVNNRIISGFKIFVLDSKDVNELFNTSVKSALKWLAKKFPPTPPIEIDFLKSICQRYLGNEIWCRFRTERDSRMCDVIKDIYKLIDCYNAGVDKLTEIITNEDLFNHPSFPLEFRIYLDSSSPYPKPYEFIPSNVRTSENIATIKDYMKQLKLPVPSTSFNPMSVACMQQQIRTYCNQIGWFEDPEEVVCKVVAIIPIELSDINMPREDFTKYFAHYDLIDFLNIIIYEKINRLNNFNNRFAIYEKTVLQEHCTFNWLYDLQVISEMKHKAIEYEDELDYFIEAKRRKIAMDSIEYLMLEDKDSTMVEEDIKTTEFNISKYNDCSEAVKQLEKELDEEKKKSIEFENMLRAALADV